MAKNNFTLTLDTLAPEGSIVRPAQFLNDLTGKEVTISSNDAVLMKVWFDTVPAGDISKAPTSFEKFATKKAVVLPSEGTYYAHVILRDEVANDSAIISSEEIVYDVTAPVIEGFLMTDLDGSDIITNAYTVNYVFNYSDTLAGCTSARIYGDHIEEQTFNVAGSGSKEGQITIKSTAPQGDIKVFVEVTDNAGNVGTANDTIILDTEMDTPILAIRGLSDGDWTNATSITTVLTSGDTDIVAYKIWEVGTTEPEYTPISTNGSLSVEKVFEISTEGKHEFTAKVKDSAGTEATTTTRSINVDQSAPVVTAAVDKTLVSHVEGHNVVKFSYTSDCSISGEKSVVVGINGTTYNGDIAAVASTNFVEGANTITVTVTDIAGNVNSASASVTLDTKAPANIELDGTLNSWYKDENPFGVSVRATDEHVISTMYAWTIGPDGNANIIPDGTTAVAVTGNPQAIIASDIKWGHAQAENNYLCVAVVDEVGNIGYLTPVSFGFDSVKPEGTVKFEKTIYGSQSAKVLISYSDATSGVAQMKLEGDITSIDWENVAETRSVELTKGDSLKSVKIKFRDVAGNESEWIDGLNSAELDESKPSAAITLFKEDGVTTKPQVSAEAKTVVKISYTDADGRGAVEYKLYGDFAESSEEWVAFSTDKGTDSKSITVTAIAPTTEEKVARNFHVVVRDNAGNESPVASASFYLDPTKPEADVQDLDHNRISKVHEYRNCIVETHLPGDSYADEVKFYIAPSEIITEYKVCAYLDAEAAKAGKPTDTAIPMTAGSVHMSGTTNSAERIDCLIKGADYEAALGGEGHDGAHFVVVYVKNEADLWSASYLEA